MSEFLQVTVLALMPGVGNFVGGLVSEVIMIYRHRLGIPLHAAAGIVLAVIALKLMPRALDGEPAWALSCFVGGGGFFVLVDRKPLIIANLRAFLIWGFTDPRSSLHTSCASKRALDRWHASALGASALADVPGVHFSQFAFSGLVAPKHSTDGRAQRTKREQQTCHRPAAYWTGCT